MIYKISKLWNRFAYLIIRIGYTLIWDYTKGNADLLKNEKLANRYTKDMLCTF